ncbi:hypothetical protein H4219_004366 [Mycoemilia scoparia]|uniref:Uncharacterized protein n=1 Tax=Mycoemilia scoparia TaxID=417184 RepID=A0A9W7ZYI8_9FUNG|nr:hypothetical protein H4219_004366 [Mycoemilia scoparia]
MVTRSVVDIMSETNYIEKAISILDFLISSKFDITSDNLPNPKGLLEMFLKIDFDAIALCNVTLKDFEGEYDDYCQWLEKIEGMRSATDILSRIHSSPHARKFFRDLNLEIMNSIYTGRAKKEGLLALKKFVDYAEPFNTDRSNGILKKINVFLKMFDLYNMKFDKVTHIDQYLEFTKDIELAEIRKNLTDAVANGRSIWMRKSAWMELCNLIQYLDYVNLVRDLNIRSIHGLGYGNHFDYILDYHDLPERKSFMGKVDYIITKIRPHYEKLINRIIDRRTEYTQDADKQIVAVNPKIKIWNFGYHYNKFKDRLDFSQAKIVQGERYMLSKVIAKVFDVFASSTGYEICNDDVEHYPVGVNVALKCKVISSNSKKTQMYVYIGLCKRNEEHNYHFKYIHRDTSDDYSIPCIMMDLPLADQDSSADFEDFMIKFDDVLALFQMFGKVAYYAIFQPKFLPRYNTPNLRTMENPHLKLKLFETIFKNIVHEPNILRDIVSPTHALVKLNIESENDEFVQASNQLKDLYKCHNILKSMNCLVGWKFAQFMYSETYCDIIIQDLLNKEYHRLCNNYLQLDYDINENVTPFTENTQHLQLEFLPDSYFKLYANLVYANIYYVLEQTNIDSNDISQKLMRFILKLCYNIGYNIIANGDDSSNGNSGDRCSSRGRRGFKSQIESLLRSEIVIDIYDK